jgi:hypothetical protein
MKNGTTEKEFKRYEQELKKAIYTLGAILFSPFFALLALAYGVKAGAIVTLEKMLEILKNWEA